MGCKVDVLSSSHKKDELIKELGGENVYVWTEDEHKKLTNHFDVVVNTLPNKLDKDQFNSLLATVKPYGTWI